MDRFIYQDLQERCDEGDSTSGADRSGSVIEPLLSNEQLALERRNLQEVEQLLKSVDKVLNSSSSFLYMHGSLIVLVIHGVPTFLYQIDMGFRKNCRLHILAPHLIFHFTVDVSLFFSLGIIILNMDVFEIKRGMHATGTAERRNRLSEVGIAG